MTTTDQPVDANECIGASITGLRFRTLDHVCEDAISRDEMPVLVLAADTDAWPDCHWFIVDDVIPHPNDELEQDYFTYSRVRYGNVAIPLFPYDVAPADAAALVAAGAQLSMAALLGLVGLGAFTDLASIEEVLLVKGDVYEQAPVDGELPGYEVWFGIAFRLREQE